MKKLIKIFVGSVEELEEEVNKFISDTKVTILKIHYAQDIRDCGIMVEYTNDY